MMTQKVERVDTIALIIAILKKMGVQQVIDSIFIPHGNWSGLSYGQLAVLFITYVLHSLTHHFFGVESWVNQHRTVIERATGWQLAEKDATDDRLGRLSEVLGGNDAGAWLHLLVEEKGKKTSGIMVETLTSLQKRILSILQLPENIYELSFKLGQKEIGIQR